MIEIKTKYKRGAKKNAVDISCRIDGYSNEIIEEVTVILKCLYEKLPNVFMDAIEMHIKDCFDEVEREGDND